MRAFAKSIYARGLVVTLVLIAADLTASAQRLGEVDVHQPLDQFASPGTVGYWSGMLGRATPGYFQPLRVSLPSNGRVAVYAGRSRRLVPVPESLQFGAAVGNIYRLRISKMPEFPGIELYPSVEIIDRLHPPAGAAQEYPVPIDFTFEEIQLALQHRMVTKVVYLEQPQLAAPVDLQRPLNALTMKPRKNLLAEADRLGRPMVIIRLGGRLPDPAGQDMQFFGSGAPVSVLPSKPNGDNNNVSAVSRRRRELPRLTTTAQKTVSKP